jgi:hypothetical protein
MDFRLYPDLLNIIYNIYYGQGVGLQGAFFVGEQFVRDCDPEFRPSTRGRRNMAHSNRVI